MKENILKSTIAIALAGLGAYFNIILIPLVILILLLVCDWVTGMTKAWITKTVSSKIGAIGIIKKVSYMFTVAVAMVVDWISQSILTQMGVDFTHGVFLFGMIVIVWLIINELTSILENLSVIGVPLPLFLIAVVKKLKITVEDKVNTDTTGEQ